MKRIEMLYKSIVTCMMLCICAASAAQPADAATEFRKIREYYGGSDFKHVVGVMVLKNEKSGTVFDKVDFEYWLQGMQVYSRMNYIEILSNNSVYLMANKRSKTVYARKKETAVKNASAGGLLDAGQLGQLLAQKNAHLKLESEGNIRRIVVTDLKDSRFLAVTISFNAADHSIVGLNAEVRPQAGSDERLMLEMHYKSSERSATGDPSVFSETRFFVPGHNGKYQFTKAYQDYKKI